MIPTVGLSDRSSGGALADLILSVNQQSTVLSCYRRPAILKIFFARAYGAREPLSNIFSVSKNYPLMSPFVWVCQRPKLKFSFTQNISWSSVSPGRKLRKRNCISHIQVKLSLLVKLFEELRKQYRFCYNKSDNSMAVAHTTWSSFTACLITSGKHWNMSTH